MEWTRSETIGLASASCVFCRGLGLRKTPVREATRPCGCVFRAIFRACFARYRHCIERAGRSSQMTLENLQGPLGYRVWGRRNEEYVADFELVCRRSLSGEELDVFEYHFLQGLDWKQCVDKLGVDKGVFFHRVYGVQEKLGRVFRELRPYALFPLDEYFSTVAMSRPAGRVTTLPLPSSEASDENVDTTVVARTNVIEMPRRNDTVASRFPLQERKLA